MTLISAHRCGAGEDTDSENTLPALHAAIALGVEYVEFDVQRCADGVFVLYHDDTITIDGQPVPVCILPFDVFAAHVSQFLRYDEALDALRGRAKAHIDFKFTSPTDTYSTPHLTYEVSATQQALAVLGEGNFIVTTMEDPSVRCIRDWADSHHINLLVGLSLGRDVRGMPPWQRISTRLSELFPHRRYRRCRANLVVVNYRLARRTVARYAARHGLPMLVWTVDDPAEIEHWLHDERAWLLTSNHPATALGIRTVDRIRRAEG